MCQPLHLPQMSTAVSHRSRGISWGEGDRTSGFPKHPSKADYLKSAHDPHCKSRPGREDRKTFIAMFQGSFLESFVHLQRRCFNIWMSRDVPCSEWWELNAAPFLGPTCMKHGFIFAASTAIEFLNLHDRRVSLWSHWKSLSASASSRTPSSCQSVLSHMLLEQSRYFYSGHRIVSGTFSCCCACPHPAGSQQGTSGTSGHSGKQEQQPGPIAGTADSPSFTSFRPVKTWSSHNQ